MICTEQTDVLGYGYIEYINHSQFMTSVLQLQYPRTLVHVYTDITQFPKRISKAMIKSLLFPRDILSAFPHLNLSLSPTFLYVQQASSFS